MIYPFITIGLVVAFIIYVLYLALIKKNLKSKTQTVVLPGLFFIGVWLGVYYFF
ncbi:MAG: hypothetical protein WCY89_02815 [Flavobacteriaceae bacterium]